VAVAVKVTVVVAVVVVTVAEVQAVVAVVDWEAADSRRRKNTRRRLRTSRCRNISLG
jgi:hypothetical protein